MARHLHRTIDLTIANGGTDSNIIVGTDGRVAFGASHGITIWAPATLTGVITVLVSYKTDPNTEFGTLQLTPGTDVTIAAAKAVVIPHPGFYALRLHSASVEGAQRVFQLVTMVDGAL